MNQLVVVANRLPVHRAGGRGAWTRSSGGLAVALDRVLLERGGTWVGWRGGRNTKALPDDLGYQLEAIDLSAEEVRDYYDGMSNAALWPLYHDQIRPPIYRSDWWHAYRTINERFAHRVARTAPFGASVWVHDYHLQLVPALLRRLRPDVRIGFFLHIPFPPSNLFARLPWRDEVIEGILGAHVIGFQTERDVGHFLESCDRLTPGGTADLDQSAAHRTIEAFPIAADTQFWEDLAHQPEVQGRTAELRESFGNPGTVLLSVDRLDYSKGLEQRLHTINEMLESGQLVVPDAVMVQVAVPSRDRTAAYRAERSRVEELVGRINGQHAELGAAPIQYIHRALDSTEIAALYRVADVMLVTPYHDGMNLVAKEFVASRTANRGVLILSEFAGAAAELSEAIIINPHHPDALRTAITAAMRMPKFEVTRRMKSMRKSVMANTVHDWAAKFLAQLDEAA